MPINKPAVQALVAALRSDEFQQGCNSLITTYVDESGETVKKYCCLGVACVVAKRFGLAVEETRGGFFTEVSWDENQPNYSEVDLPKGVQMFYGFTSPNPHLEIIRPGEIISHPVGATSVNDVLKFDFTLIADAFERTYLSDSENEEE